MKLTDTPPVHCSACWAQQVALRHVDFESSWDGPTFDEKVHAGDKGTVRNLTVAIDELIVCEQCMATAARLLGWHQPSALSSKNEALEQQLDTVHADLAAEKRYTAKLEAALEEKPVRTKKTTKKVAA